ncbi:MAG TPA: spore germination protein [Firmicutes bacterium]|nr:spore germination protein [Bacillota bacterium]
MFKKIWRKAKYFMTIAGTEQAEEDGEEGMSLSPVLGENLHSLRQRLGKSSDIIMRRIILNLERKVEAAVVYVEGLADEKVINDHILSPLLKVKGTGKKDSVKILEYLADEVITVGGVRRTGNIDRLVSLVLAGDTLFLLDGSARALLLSTRGWEKRALQEPDTEIIIKGPRIGFVETLRVNTALLRREIGHPDLTLESLEVGAKTKTEVCIAYLQGLTDQRLVDEVKRRIRRINTDAILAAGFLEEFIEDAPLSPFATVTYTERPDVAAAKILEGRVAIFTDGTPVVNTVPALFIESFQSPDDYTFRFYYSTIIRWIRYLSFALSILSPAIYVSLATFHQELLPTTLLISMAAATEGTPLPTVLEAVGLGLVFELLREAGIRLPRPIGQAVSIVGALVIGEAVVSAGLISAPTVIVVALTAISSFVAPVQVGVAALLRLGLTVIAGLLGAFGIVLALLVVLVHLASLRSFGVPFLSPVAPLVPRDLKDVVVRAPLWAMLTRPKFIGRDPQRQSFDLRPAPPGITEQKKDSREKEGDQG